VMNKTYLTGSILLGLAVYCLSGTYGLGADTVATILIDLGCPAEYSDNGSRSISGALLATAIVLLISGYPSDGRIVSHEEFIAVKENIEAQEALAKPKSRHRH